MNNGASKILKPCSEYLLCHIPLVMHAWFILSGWACYSTQIWEKGGPTHNQDGFLIFHRGTRSCHQTRNRELFCDFDNLDGNLLRVRSPIPKNAFAGTRVSPNIPIRGSIQDGDLSKLQVFPRKLCPSSRLNCRILKKFEMLTYKNSLTSCTYIVQVNVSFLRWFHLTWWPHRTGLHIGWPNWIFWLHEAIILHVL